MKKFLGATFLFACIALAFVYTARKGDLEALPTPPAAAPASALYLNGLIHTGVPSSPWAEALVTQGDKLVFVGSNEDARGILEIPDRIIDLDGQFVMAGMVDSHTHPGLVAILGGDDDSADKPMPAKPKQAILDWLRDHKKAKPFALTVIQGEWDVSEFLPKGPNKALLDEIYPLKPVLLFDNSGHSVWVNSAMMTLMGIDRDTPDISENISFFVRDENGEPTGWVKEFALMPYLQDLMLPGQGELRAGLLQQLNFLASKGVTTLWDAGNFDMDDAVYKELAILDRAGLLPVRYEGSYHIWNPQQIDEAKNQLLALRERYAGNKLRFNTIKIHFDGVAEILTAGMLEPYATESDNSGGVLFTTARLADFMLELDDVDIDLHLHVVGDRATRTALNAWESARQSKGKGLGIQLTLSHLETVHPDDIQRFQKLGVHANFTPHWFGGTVFGEAGSINLGPERSSRSQVVGEFIKADANVTLSSDVVSGEEAYRSNPFIGIEMSVTRQEFGSGDKAEILSPKEAAIEVEDALSAYTINGARQLAMEQQIGSLEAGKQADFIVLSANPLTVATKTIHQIRPVATLVAGQLVYGELTDQGTEQ